MKLFLRRYPGTNDALIVSKNVEVETRIEGVSIHVVPVWKFLLDPKKYGVALMLS